MSHGWGTKKNETGFSWSVTRFEYGVGTTVLQSGICSTREKATRRAKQWVLYYRRGGK